MTQKLILFQKKKFLQKLMKITFFHFIYKNQKFLAFFHIINNYLPIILIILIINTSKHNIWDNFWENLASGDKYIIAFLGFNSKHKDSYCKYSLPWETS